jgi:hypothetical protein
MKSFLKWMEELHGLDEKGLRTALGIYPPAYGAAQYPPLFFAPISPTAVLSFQTIHKDLLKNVRGEKKKTTKKKKGRKKKKT